MSCVNSSCCCCHGPCQPVSSSGPAVDAAGNATTGTNDTINSLIVNGSNTLTAAVKGIVATKQQAVKAQSQIATSSIWAGALVLIGIVAVIGFVIWGRKGGA
jgi:hypothetical protein